MNRFGQTVAQNEALYVYFTRAKSYSDRMTNKKTAPENIHIPDLGPSLKLPPSYRHIYRVQILG